LAMRLSPQEASGRNTGEGPDSVVFALQREDIPYSL
jgi:hypothetical protein